MTCTAHTLRLRRLNERPSKVLLLAVPHGVFLANKYCDVGLHDEHKYFQNCDIKYVCLVQTPAKVASSLY